ncbi:MAG: FAD-dependent oxidoreductase [Gammaproteobacteria bacterium]
MMSEQRALPSDAALATGLPLGQGGRTHQTAISYDAVIVGGGIVGCTTALLLRRALPDLRVAIIEQQSFREPFFREPRFSDDVLWSRVWRVSALSLSVRAILSQLGVWTDLVEQGLCPYHDMVLTDADGSGRLHLSAQDAGESCLGYIVENEAVHRVSGLDVSKAPMRTRVFCHQNNTTARNPVVTILETPLVVGAEGRGSVVRELAGFSTRHVDYGQSALVCQMQLDRPHGWTAWQDFHETGPVAFLPLTQRTGFDPALEMGWPAAQETERVCSLVWSLPSAEAAHWMQHATTTAFQRALNRVAPSGVGTIERCSVLQAFPLVGHTVQQLIQPGVVLVGDAAHGYHPMAGQGLNVGVLDAAVLVDQLVLRATRSGRFAHPAALRRYERLRRFHHASMFALTSGLHDLYGRSAWCLRMGRNLGLSALDRLGVVKKGLIYMANGHRTDLPERYREGVNAALF